MERSGLSQTEIDVIVTNHATLRWIERVCGIDIGRLNTMSDVSHRKLLAKLAQDHNTEFIKWKSSILTPSVLAALDAGAMKFVTPNFVLIFKAGRIVTVLEPGMREARPVKGRSYKRMPR